VLKRFTSIQPAGKRMNQKRKRSSARLNSRCREDHSDENGAKPGNFGWLRRRQRDATTREIYVASIAQREKGGQKEGRYRASDCFF